MGYKAIWQDIQTAASGAWELIKNVILGPVLLLIDLVTGNFTKLKEDALNIRYALCLFHALYEPFKAFLCLLVDVGKVGVEPAACEKIGVCNLTVLLQIVQMPLSRLSARSVRSLSATGTRSPPYAYRLLFFGW